MKIKIGVKNNDRKWKYLTFVFETEKMCHEFLRSVIPEETSNNEKITIERIE